MQEFSAVEGMKYIYPILVGFMILEYLVAKKNYELKDSLAGFGIALGASVVAAFTKVFTVLVVFQWFFDVLAPFRAQYLGYASIGFAWWAWVLAVLADDFNFYWHHRFSHTVRLLWAAHVPHHSSKNFNFAVSIRNGWFITLYKPVFWLWMACVGFEPIMIGTALIINSTYQYFLHTKLLGSLGFLGKIFNNPHVHAVHHSSNVEYLDKNHGGIFLLWDHVFGTWQNIIPGVKPKYGILKDPKTYNPIKLNTHEFEDIFRDVKRSKSFKEKFMYIFGPPGWSPDNSTLTAKQIQAGESPKEEEPASAAA
ncbi:sterol desaturase family protein [Ekhidna sp.]|uniref:sterol desaturase family protein n=1 Tax=Ekhidna sp. TaxID=2608089 RepID=UPI0032EB7A05